MKLNIMNISILNKLLPLFIEVSSLLHIILIVLIVCKACKRRLNSMLLPHFKVLSKVLISRPPWKMHLRSLLIPSHLMKVRVSHIIFLHILRHSILCRNSREHIRKSTSGCSVVFNHSSFCASALHN